MKITKSPLTPKRELPWSETRTLEQWVVSMILAGKQNTEEFQAALNFWTRERFTEIWLEYKQKEKECEK